MAAVSVADSFPLMWFPAEIRRLIFSLIILPKHGRSKESYRRRRQTKGDQQYFDQREVCHETAKALLLVSKQIHQETISLFCRNKTVLLSTLYQAIDDNYPTSTILDSSTYIPLANIRHIAFDMKLTREDVIGESSKLQDNFTGADSLLKRHIKHLPNLKTITFKVAESAYIEEAKSAAAVLDLRTCDLLHQLAHQPSGSTPWVHTDNRFLSKLIQGLLTTSKPIHQHADDLGRATLDSSVWACSKTLYKSQWYMVNGSFVQGYFVHELVFERRTGIKTSE